jgi:hypothetical protein
LYANPKATASPSAPSAPARKKLMWVWDFETIEKLRLALTDLAHWYYGNWLVPRHRCKTPTKIRENQNIIAGCMNKFAAAYLINGMQYINTLRYRGLLFFR